MSVTLAPSNALGFNRPLTQTVKRSLTIHNHNDTPVAFKVKTTAPKLYCVRPNSGRVEPGEFIDVQVMLQAMKEEPPLAAKCKDKFLIQSTFITADKETSALQEIWNATDDSNDTTKVHQHKIKVVYLPPEGQALEEEDEGHMSSVFSGNDSIQYQYATVRQPDMNGHMPSMPEFAAEQGENMDDVIARSKTPAEEPPSPIIQVTHDAAPAQPPSPVKPMPPPILAPSILAPSKPTVKAVPEDAHNELLAKYNEAQAELQRMRALLASMPDTSVAQTSAAPTTLRRRNGALSDAMSGTSAPGTYAGETETGYYGSETGYGTTTAGSDVDTTFSQPDGVPLQIVIAIALGVFLTTYMFF